jgi:hypothetical protein
MLLTDSQLEIYHFLIALGLESSQRSHHRGCESRHRSNAVTSEKKN